MVLFDPCTSSTKVSCELQVQRRQTGMWNEEWGMRYFVPVCLASGY